MIKKSRGKYHLLREHWLLGTIERDGVVPDGMGAIAEVVQCWKSYGESVASEKSCPGRWINGLKSMTMPACAGLDYFVIPAHAQ